jgi:5-methylcytosine-specific restriction endonuclease McrA
MDPTLPDSKACSKCLVEKPIDDFHKKSAAKDEHEGACKDCRKAQGKIYCQKNAEAIAAKKKIYRKDNAEAAATTQKIRRKKNAVAIAAQGKLYRKGNAEAISLRTAAYRKENLEAYAMYQKTYREDNPERVREGSRRRRARKLDNGVEYYTEAQVLELYGTDCYLCNGPIDLDAARRAGQEGWQFSLHVDHVQPISKGGPDSLANVRPAHGLCNLKKNATWDDPA